jgi:hypothetical protein
MSQPPPPLPSEIDLGDVGPFGGVQHTVVTYEAKWLVRIAGLTTASYVGLVAYSLVTGRDTQALEPLKVVVLLALGYLAGDKALPRGNG